MLSIVQICSYFLQVFSCYNVLVIIISENPANLLAADTTQVFSRAACGASAAIPLTPTLSPEGRGSCGCEAAARGLPSFEEMDGLRGWGFRVILGVWL